MEKTPIICTKCKSEVEYNESTSLWEDENVLLCALGPFPFKHAPPWDARRESKPEPKSEYDGIVYSGYGFIG